MSYYSDPVSSCQALQPPDCLGVMKSRLPDLTMSVGSGVALPFGTFLYPINPTAVLPTSSVSPSSSTIIYISLRSRLLVSAPHDSSEGRSDSLSTILQ